MAYGFLLLDGTTMAAPDKNLTKKGEFATIMAQFGDGYIQRAPKGINSLKETHDIAFVNRSETEIQAIMDFFEDKKGVTAFDFTYPSAGGEVTIKVICETYNTVFISDDVYSCNATFKRVYEL